MKRQLRGTVNLPGSKSESNRALMIAAYGGFMPDIANLSDAHDTTLLQSLLEKVKQSTSPDAVTVDCEDAGTVSRFMMTYLSGIPGEWLLTGTKRLCERPMAPLIDALRQLGADVECLEKEGSLPVRVRGRDIKGGEVLLDASKSSQFVTSLLLAAPTWEKGLRLVLTTETVSEPYIDMTLSMMRHFGVQTVREDNVIAVAHQPYCQRPFAVSSDWSAASYWYEMLALSSGGSLLLKGLRYDSLQGDAVVADFFRDFGVMTEYVPEGVMISSTGAAEALDIPLIFDFSNTPDLFPSILVTCVALHKEAVFNGITTLYNKESDRVNSLISELCRLYTFINILSYNKLVIYKSSLLENIDYRIDLTFNTYQDHRVVMALAGLKMIFSGLAFDNPEVVNKSFSSFWEEMRKVLENKCIF